MADQEAAQTQRRQYHQEVVQAARGLYLKRCTVTEIAEALAVPRRTVYHWAAVNDWDSLLSHETAEEAAARRFAYLVEREPKTAQDLKELELLVSHLERLQGLRLREAARRRDDRQDGDAPRSGAGDEQAGDRVPRRGEAGDSPSLTGREGGRHSRRRNNKKPQKNDVSELTRDLFQEKIHTKLFDYQKKRRETAHQRNRMELKSRQIGFTWDEALFAFEDAALTGDNHIFLSATRAQANVFRNYIIQSAAEDFGITLTGNPIVLKTAPGKLAELHFLSNNSKSAQSYHGHVHIDEFFWISKFPELFKLATGMASHAKWRRSLLSTPSIISHPAYPYWAGSLWQKRFARPKPWPGFTELQSGLLCPDSWFRQIITLEDAIAGGCDLFDIEQLRLEYTPDEFRQLFCCEFIDDAAAVFSLALLERCMADPADWAEFNPALTRPVGDRPVWGGYDPAHTGDQASFAVLLPPVKAGEAFKVLERHRWAQKSYLWQVERIRELAQKYHFSYIGVDTTGPGIGVWEQVRQFIPTATAINYGVASKAEMVLKALEVMEQNRLLYDAGDTAIPHAFMTIRQTSTQNGAITYASSRNEETGHGDAAWAIMQALIKERLAQQSGASGGIVFATSQ